MSTLETGEVGYKQGNERFYLAVSGGYAEVLDNVVTLLADAAEFAREINAERAQGARERAEKRMAELNPDDREFVEAEAALRRALVRLQVAGRAAGK